MSTAAVTTGIAGTSPRVKAGIANVFYFLTLLTACVALFASGGLVASGNAAATATSITAHEPLFRLGFGADLLVIVSYIAVTALFYDLFGPVNRRLSLLAAFVGLAGCAVQALGYLFYRVPFVVLGGAQYLSAFKVEQLQALVRVSLRLGAPAYKIGLAFFGFYCLLIAYLIFRSTFLPRVLGVLMALAGLGWLTFLATPRPGDLPPAFRPLHLRVAPCTLDSIAAEVKRV